MTKKSRIISRKTNEKSMPSAFRKSFAFLWLAVLTMAEIIDKKKDVMTHYFMKTRYFIMLFVFNHIILPKRNIFSSEQEAFKRTTKEPQKQSRSEAWISRKNRAFPPLKTKQLFF